MSCAVNVCSKSKIEAIVHVADWSTLSDVEVNFDTGFPAQQTTTMIPGHVVLVEAVDQSSEALARLEVVGL
jgi:hypothetical protein